MEKGILFERTSSKDQHPELQHKDNIEFCKSKGIEIVGEPFREKVSAYKKGAKRIEWEKCVEVAKENKYNIILWRYDRAFRNREKFFEFMKVMFEVHGVKIYSVKEPSILMLWEMIDKANDIQDVSMREFMKGQMKLLWEFQIRQAGETAQEESEKRSQRTKLAVVKEEGKKAVSYKGNLWGRKNISDEVKQAIVERFKQDKSYSEICDEVFYWDKNNNKKYVSRGLVHKIILEFKQSNPSF